MAITFLDPRAEPSAPVEPYAATTDWSAASGEPLTIGLLANGFPDSENFLRCVERALLTRLPEGTATRFLNKGNASAPASPAQIDAIAAEVAVAVTAYGH
jgi:hypothetical protein